MDEYKEYLYARDPDKYAAIDAGDLSVQRAIREKLQCKPFKWFMEEVAFDLPKKYPPVEPQHFAAGTIRSVASPDLCADTMNSGNDEPIGLFACADDHARPQANQFFVNSWHKDLRLRSRAKCWDVSSGEPNAPVIFYDCHEQQGNQFWRYDPVSSTNNFYMSRARIGIEAWEFLQSNSWNQLRFFIFFVQRKLIHCIDSHSSWLILHPCHGMGGIPVRTLTDITLTILTDESFQGII